MPTLPGSLNAEELRAVKRLARALAADGYRVAEVAIGAGGEPAAVVYAAKQLEPVVRMVVAARSFLRAVDDFEGLEPEVPAEEFETLQALRTAARRVATNAKVLCTATGDPTLGEVAHAEFGRQARFGADREE
jgi:shikimate 5-dehydrogenase